MIIAFEVRDDELSYFKDYQNYNIKIVNALLNKANIDLCDNYLGVSIVGNSIIDKDIIDILINKNIKYLSTRTVGLDHIDVKYAKKVGLIVSNSSYPANGVSEFTIMLMLMAIRHTKTMIERTNINDYSLVGLIGNQLSNMTIGVIGTGNIGAMVCKILYGFGCKILAYDNFEKDSLKDIVNYVGFEDLLRDSDLISLHIPYYLNDPYLIDDKEINMMKKGVVIVNCARGQLVSNKALIKGLDNHHIGALALDTFENEKGIIFNDLRLRDIYDKDIVYLRQCKNVIMTPHIAFYTDTNIKEMVRISMDWLIACVNKKESS